MKNKNCKKIITSFSVIFMALSINFSKAQITVLHNVSVIDGTGKPVKYHQNIVISNDRILSITDTNAMLPTGASIINMDGKTIMPLIINVHAHLGLLKDTSMASANYTEENIRRHLLKFQEYGIGAILSMGTDHPEIFSLREQSHAGKIPGAIIYTAGIGFGVNNGVPPVSYGMDKVYRPESEDEARKEVQEIAKSKPDVIKIWVDDFWGKFPKMKPEIYKAIISEAHKNGIRVAAHLYYLEDARSLVNSGLDIMAHSIRDKEIDDAMLQLMKEKNVVYIPTLSLDEFAYIYEGNPNWMNDPFFKNSLEPQVFEMINSEAYKNKIKNNPVTPQEMDALKNALTNVKKVYDAGIMIALGTDAGAQPVRAMGFSEHMELELMVKAGINPLETIKIASQNGAVLLKANKDLGTLEAGKKASFIILDKNPADAIINSRTIFAVWKDGKKVSDGPVH